MCVRSQELGQTSSEDTGTGIQGEQFPITSEQEWHLSPVMCRRTPSKWVHLKAMDDDDMDREGRENLKWNHKTRSSCLADPLRRAGGQHGET